jgi:hypothetical protein
MNKDLIIEDSKGSWQRNRDTLGNRGFQYFIKCFHNITVMHVATGLSGLTSIISFACLLFGMTNGFWPGAYKTFSLNALITSPSGIILLFGYLISLNLFYFQLVKTKKKTEM